jgi:hypothetical protein
MIDLWFSDADSMLISSHVVCAYATTLPYTFLYLESTMLSPCVSEMLLLKELLGEFLTI